MTEFDSSRVHRNGMVLIFRSHIKPKPMFKRLFRNQGSVKYIILKSWRCTGRTYLLCFAAQPRSSVWLKNISSSKSHHNHNFRLIWCSYPFPEYLEKFIKFMKTLKTLKKLTSHFDQWFRLPAAFSVAVMQRGRVNSLEYW